MTDRDKLIKLIDAVFEWASRPTRDGAKNLRNLADSLDPRNSDSNASDGSTELKAGGVLIQEMVEEAALKATKKGL